MDDIDRIERRFPILFSPDKGFEAPILVKTLTEASKAIRGPMETVVGVGTLGDDLTERVAMRPSGEFRIAVFASSVRIRRRIGDRWNAISIEIEDGSDPTRRSVRTRSSAPMPSYGRSRPPPGVIT